MSALPEQWGFLATGWRFAKLLTGCREGAAKVFKETVDEVARHPDAGSMRRTKMLFFNALHRKALRFPARSELTGVSADLHGLFEPGRSALALLQLEALSSDEIEHVLSIDEKALEAAVQKARAQLLIDSDTLSEQLATVQPDEEDDREIEAAAASLANRQGGLRISAKNPATLAVAIGFLLLVAVLTWHFLGEAGIFPDEAVKIATTGAAARPDQFDPVDNKASELKDWFMLKGFDTFQLPPGLEKYHVAGVRIFKFENEPVAQAAIQENTMFFYAFAAQPLGISVVPEKTWRITEADRWVMAIREEKNVCFMIAFRGSKKQMEEVIRHAQENAGP